MIEFYAWGGKIRGILWKVTEKEGIRCMLARDLQLRRLKVHDKGLQ
jgi:hypothetical protein